MALVHYELVAVATGGAHRSTACRHCRAWELAAEGAKGRRHSRDPYQLHGWATEGQSLAGDEENNRRRSSLDVGQMEVR
jgi:hypothetical protein